MCCNKPQNVTRVSCNVSWLYISQISCYLPIPLFTLELMQHQYDYHHWRCSSANCIIMKNIDNVKRQRNTFNRRECAIFVAYCMTSLSQTLYCNAKLMDCLPSLICICLLWLFRSLQLYWLLVHSVTSGDSDFRQLRWFADRLSTCICSLNPDGVIRNIIDQ